MEEKVEQLMINNGSTYKSGEPDVNDDGGDEISKIEGGDDVPDETEEVEGVGDDRYEVVTGTRPGKPSAPYTSPFQN